MAEHEYMSTSCVHGCMESLAGDAVAGLGLHERCRQVCKFCPARCMCPCHEETA